MSKTRKEAHRVVVEPVTVTIYRHNVAGGRRRRWFTRKQAYHSAALAMVNNACDCTPDWALQEGDAPESCDYCSRICAGRRRGVKGQRLRHYFDQDSGQDCSEALDHSYRYLLVARLARWLRWRDERRDRTS